MKQIKIPLPFPIGTLVTYYDEGWRAGHFDGMATKVDAIIRPIGPQPVESRPGADCVCFCHSIPMYHNYPCCDRAQEPPAPVKHD